MIRTCSPVKTSSLAFFATSEPGQDLGAAAHAIILNSQPLPGDEDGPIPEEELWMAEGGALEINEEQEDDDMGMVDGDLGMSLHAFATLCNSCIYQPRMLCMNLSGKPPIPALLPEKSQKTILL